ncbi:MAG: isoprenylcysteine carboxylmethyltransferase family protein [Candidatus Lokiarchaeota archaeon]|nr:isoprenylcysteine carboxylmethyltransferase family protein [Candidatus Lokiarchaeota archaeon]
MKITKGVKLKMQQQSSKVKFKINSILTTITSLLIPIFQYVPCTAIWFGIMSVPLLAYILLYFQFPQILWYDIQFLIRTEGFYVVLFGLILYVYSLVYQLSHRGRLLTKGPYRFTRHPQYLAFMIMTLGMTIVAFQTSPIFRVSVSYEHRYSILTLIWIVEVVAYLILGKIEEIALKAKYGDGFLEYKNKVSFIIPFLKFPSHKTITDNQY